jgi:hypothetical protein
MTSTLTLADVDPPDVDHLDVVGSLTKALLEPGELRIHRHSSSAVEKIGPAKVLYFSSVGIR